MLGLAIVRGAAQRDLLVGEAEVVGSPALDHRQALEGLDGGTRIDRRRDAALGCHHVTRTVDHGIGAAVAALDDVATGDFGDHGIDHARFSSSVVLCGEAATYHP